jgi:PDZ domain
MRSASRLARRGVLLAVLSTAAIVVAGCGGSKHATTAKTTTQKPSSAKSASSPNTLPASIPRPNFAVVLPANYRAKRVWYQPLSNTNIPDAVITSTGPPVGSLSFHSADLQVLSYDRIAKRWIVAFDAQKIPAPDTTFGTSDSNAPINSYIPPASASTTTTAMLDPKADVGIGQVAFVRFAPGQGTDLVFTASTSYGGSGVGSQLQVVSFKNQEASIIYSWSGEGLFPFRIAGAPPRQRLLESAWFWTLEDAHCCPLRTYKFTVAAAGSGNSSYINDIQDQRPWLGVYVQPLKRQDPSSPVQVMGVVQGSPAARVFHQGDVILSIQNARKVKNPPTLGPDLIDEFAQFNAGDTGVFVVRRGGATLTLRARLRSMIDSSALGAAPPPGNYSIATI